MPSNTDHNQYKKVATIGIRELKAKVSEIIRQVESGKEFVITRHGRTCGKLAPFKSPDRSGNQIRSLRGGYPDLPELSDQDFQEAKHIWQVTT